MTQAITLYSLPPEILSIIISFINPDIVEHLIRLILVSKRSESIFSAIPYIEVLDVSQNNMLKLFTGVKHLRIMNEEISLRSFSTNIFNNLKSLILSITLSKARGQTCELYEFIIMESYFERELEDVKQIQEVQTLFMPELRFLHILDNTTNYHVIRIKTEVIPNLKRLRIDNHVINNLSEFKNLETLEITNSTSRYPYSELVRLRYFIILDAYHVMDWTKLEILNLRCLTLRETKINFSMLSSLNIEELELDNVIINGLKNIPRMNSLLSLTIIHHNRPEKYSLNVCAKSFPVLRYLRVEQRNNINITASSLVNIVIKECSFVLVSKSLSRYVKFISTSEYVKHDDQSSEFISYNIIS